jgi:isopentenyl phosphate kinase
MGHPKTKLLSIIASSKRHAPGHAFRHQAVAALQGKAEVYGRAYRPIEFKTEAMAPFMFSFVAENGKVESMFTEKIIDCFVTGCVPIYYGCDTIGDYFNPDGMIEVDNLDELMEVVPTLTPERYAKMLPSIVDNFNRAKAYLVAEDWICRSYPFLFV